MLSLSPFLLVIAKVDRLLILNHEVESRNPTVRITRQLSRVNTIEIKESQSVVAEHIPVVKHTRVELSEYTPTQIKLSLTVSHVILLVVSKDEDRVDITSEEADPIAECLLRRSIIDHDKVLVSLEALHNPLDRVGSRAQAGMEAVLIGETVGSRELCEVVECGKKGFHNVEC